MLGLAYFRAGSINGVQLKGWATWILYPVLVDLPERVVEALNHPFGEIPMEMLSRGPYDFVYDCQAGKYTGPVWFLAHEARLLGVVKRPRRNKVSLTSGMVPSLVTNTLREPRARATGLPPPCGTTPSPSR